MRMKFHKLFFFLEVLFFLNCFLKKTSTFSKTLQCFHIWFSHSATMLQVANIAQQLPEVGNLPFFFLFTFRAWPITEVCGQWHRKY